MRKSKKLQTAEEFAGIYLNANQKLILNITDISKA